VEVYCGACGESQAFQLLLAVEKLWYLNNELFNAGKLFVLVEIEALASSLPLINTEIKNYRQKCISVFLIRNLEALANEIIKPKKQSYTQIE